MNRVEKLEYVNDLNKKIKNLCIYRGVKYKFKRGKRIIMNSSNVEFIFPHEAILKLFDKEIILNYYDSEKMLLNDSYEVITIAQLRNLFEEMRKERLTGG